jgi:hypothetical protein
MNKLNKKHLYQLVNNDCKYKNYSKDKLVEVIYKLHFIDTT